MLHGDEIKFVEEEGRMGIWVRSDKLLKLHYRTKEHLFYAALNRSDEIWPQIAFTGWEGSSLPKMAKKCRSVFVNIEQMRSVEKMESQCQRAALESVHIRLLRACTLQKISRFQFSGDLVCNNLG